MKWWKSPSKNRNESKKFHIFEHSLERHKINLSYTRIKIILFVWYYTQKSKRFHIRKLLEMNNEFRNKTECKIRKFCSISIQYQWVLERELRKQCCWQEIWHEAHALHKEDPYLILVTPWPTKTDFFREDTQYTVRCNSKTKEKRISFTIL